MIEATSLEDLAGNLAKLTIENAFSEFMVISKLKFAKTSKDEDNIFEIEQDPKETSEIVTKKPSEEIVAKKPLEDSVTKQPSKKDAAAKQPSEEDVTKQISEEVVTNQPSEESHLMETEAENETPSDEARNRNNPRYLCNCCPIF